MDPSAPPDLAADRIRLRSQRLWFAVFTLLITACGFATACGQTAPNSGRYGTWRWDGSNWSQLANTNQGNTFFADQLFYSVAIGGLINMNGTKWSGSGWVKNVEGPTLPRAADGNQETAMVLDEANGQLLFLDPNASTMSAWSAGSWVPVVLPAQWPEARYLSSGGVGYDPDRQMVLIVSCCAAGSLETSAWDGHAIRTVETNSGLQHPSHYLMVPDGGGHMLAFGQDNGLPTGSFSWDGKAWSSLASAATLPPGVVSVAVDIGDHQILAVGTDDGKNFHTWRWQENAWQLITTTHSPPGGRVSNLVYDPVLPGFLITVLPAAGLGGII